MKMTSAKLKTIALVSMTIDHIGAILLSGVCGSFLMKWLMSAGIEFNRQYVYICFRSIGRIAFPIFAFLIVEGCLHTRNPKKYLIRLLLFALISEIPFDLALSGHFSMLSQNVFFTLFLGACMIFCFEKVKDKFDILTIAFMASILVCFSLIVTVTFTDYSYKGIIMIAIFYFFRKWKFAYFSIIFFQSLKWYYILCLFISVVLILLYNGERGKQNKWLFYIYYPAHQIILYLISQIIIKAG